MVKKPKQYTYFVIFILTLIFVSAPVYADNKDVKATAIVTCEHEDRECLFKALETNTAEIDNKSWRDRSYRELAKLLAADKETDSAIRVLQLINNPDTKALTIRGIGMAAADSKMSKEELSTLFAALRQHAETISHPPSYSIALTYIAMSQAYAGDDQGATATAKALKNDSLRNKAFAESSEIQAEQSRSEAANDSIAQIDDLAFRDKAYLNISKIFTKQTKYQDAIQAADKISNAYQKSQALLFLIGHKIKPEDKVLVE